MLASRAGIENNQANRRLLMSMGENLSSEPEHLRKGVDFCEDIRHAAELREAAERTANLAERAANKVISASFLGNIPCRLLVSIPEDASAYITVDDEVVEEQPTSFLATEIESISRHGVEFFDRPSSRRLRIEGYDFEVSPVPRDEPA